MSKLLVTVNDLKAVAARGNAGYCNTGARLKANRLGLSWRDFVIHGIDVEELRKFSSDAMVAKLIEAAERRAKAEAENG